MSETHKVIIIGSGPAGLTAALRAAQIAKAAGASVSFDPASYQMIRESRVPRKGYEFGAFSQDVAARWPQYLREVRGVGMIGAQTARTRPCAS